MKRTINESEFIRAFDEMDRSDNFSYDGRKAMFEYFEEIEEETGTEFEFDVIGICCEFTEYEDFEAFRNDYGFAYEKMEDVENKTLVITVDDDRFIVQAF